MRSSQEFNTNDNTSADENIQFQLRAPKEQRFDKAAAKDVINSILSEELAGKSYENNEGEILSKQIANRIRDTVKDSLRISKADTQYKLVLQVVLGEQRGAGIRIAGRCIWDSENDASISGSYENDSLFCVAVLFAVYVY